MVSTLSPLQISVTGDANPGSVVDFCGELRTNVGFLPFQLWTRFNEAKMIPLLSFCAIKTLAVFHIFLVVCFPNLYLQISQVQRFITAGKGHREVCPFRATVDVHVHVQTNLQLFISFPNAPFLCQ